MGRAGALIGFWLLGYALGFIGYLLSPAVAAWLMAWLPQIFVSETIVGAFLAGLGSSIITTVVVLVWAKLSR